MTNRLYFAVAVAVYAALQVPLARAEGGDPIKIGFIAPLTGGSADMGNSALIGAKVAVDEINQVGGYLGRKLELVVRDDQADPETGLKLSSDLVKTQKVTASVGFCNTGVAVKALETFQANKSILIIPCATGTILTSKYPAAGSYIFRTSARDELQTQFIVAEIVKRGLSKPALLVDSTGYGDAGLKDLQAALARANIKPHAVVRFNVGVKSLDDEVRQLKDSGADVLVGWTVGPEQGLISAGRAANNWKVPQLGSWTLSNASAYASSAGKTDGAFMVQTVLPNQWLERNATFLRNYRKLDNNEPMGSMMSAAQTYDAVQLLLRAMFDSRGDLSGPALKAALENPTGTYRGVVTTYERAFSPGDHDAISENMLWLGTWRGRERGYFYKEEERKATILRRKQSAASPS